MALFDQAMFDQYLIASFEIEAFDKGRTGDFKTLADNLFAT